jgi:hypothetical protein
MFANPFGATVRDRLEVWRPELGAIDAATS